MSEQNSMDYVRELPGFERGHPHYFKDPMIDHLLEIVLQLGAELWVNRDRQDLRRRTASRFLQPAGRGE